MVLDKSSLTENGSVLEGKYLGHPLDAFIGV